tara:strand:+ start:9438 stop:9902 length:465 start_codon:yes stop_codon:yes gene_type:complete
MADLTVNSGRKFQGEVRRALFDVGANLEVFEGQFMMTGAGGVVNSTGGAVDGGFALEYVDNRTGSVNGGAARAARVEMALEGYVWLTVANGAAFTHDDVGLPVYNDADGDTFTTTSTTNAKLGVIVNCDAAVVAGGNTQEVLVYFNMGLAHLLA